MPPEKGQAEFAVSDHTQAIRFFSGWLPMYCCISQSRERWTQVFAQFDGGHVYLLLQPLLIFRNQSHVKPDSFMA